MIWKSCDLQIKEGQTEDVLGNQTGGKWSTVKKTVCRFTPWTDEQISLEGREVTRNEQRFAIPVLFSDFPECSHAVIDGVRQEISQKIDLAPRYTVIQVKVYKE